MHLNNVIRSPPTAAFEVMSVFFSVDTKISESIEKSLELI